jgi:hypothetical protein
MKSGWKKGKAEMMMLKKISCDNILQKDHIFNLAYAIKSNYHKRT